MSGPSEANSDSDAYSSLQDSSSQSQHDVDLSILSATSSSEFSIEIPRIGLIKEIQIDVSPTDPQIYLPTLEKFVAHGKDTATPDIRNGNTYLFAHSKKTQNNTTPEGGWFSLIDELQVNDLIIIHYHGKDYRYEVSEAFVVFPNETSVYTSKSPYSGMRSVTLQTCFPRGDTSKRLIVIAKEVE